MFQLLRLQRSLELGLVQWCSLTFTQIHYRQRKREVRSLLRLS